MDELCWKIQKYVIVIYKSSFVLSCTLIWCLYIIVLSSSTNEVSIEISQFFYSFCDQWRKISKTSWTSPKHFWLFACYGFRIFCSYKRHYYHNFRSIQIMITNRRNVYFRCAYLSQILHFSRFFLNDLHSITITKSDFYFQLITLISQILCYRY